ncbi:MAG: lipoprotein [Hyphococcus sp.]|nr:MAG: lipoprotein [Marinicaulis sp.]
MAIAADGRYAGSISSGCLERAIVDEARERLRTGNGCIVRYGEGSKYLDIVLPCGSGVDILYSVHIQPDALERSLSAAERRECFALELMESGAECCSSEAKEGWNGKSQVRKYQPALQITVAGIGVELILFTRLATIAGYRICALSPDAETLEHCSGQTAMLSSSNQLPELILDPWTAFVSLFHDREWELALLKKVIESDAFYVGAVGSMKTSEARLAALREQGVDDGCLAKLRGPIGLIPATRNPSALTVSVLAEVVAAWKQ